MEVSEARPDNSTRANEGPRPGSEAARLSRRRSPGPGHARRAETWGSWQVAPAGAAIDFLDADYYGYVCLSSTSVPVVSVDRCNKHHWSSICFNYSSV